MEYTPRVLPWKDWAEWTETRKWLFAADTESRVRGVGRVKAWRARGRLPVAVDATASLLEVALLEAGTANGGGARSALELRSLYSMVIVRAINGLVEGLQTKFYAEPVNAVAARLGIPQWLVDLRHEATHSQLPSLASLRMGAQHLLDWLFRGYWEKQAQDLEQAAAAATGLLSSYQAVALEAQQESPNALSRACRIPKEENGSPSSSLVTTPSDTRLAEALEGLLGSVTASFLTAFLLPALVPVEESPDDTAAASFFLLPDKALDSQAAALTAEASLLFIAKHRQLYTPLLVRLQRRFPGFAHTLFLRMADVTSTQKDKGGPTYQMWLAYLQSRDWHSHFAHGRHDALFTLRRAPGIQFNLRDKPPENWTSAETDFMQGKASKAVLREGLGLTARCLKRSVEETGGGEGSGWRRCKSWIPTPLGGPVLPPGKDGGLL